MDTKGQKVTTVLVVRDLADAPEQDAYTWLVEEVQYFIAVKLGLL